MKWRPGDECNCSKSRFCFRAWISPDAWLLWQQKLINDGKNGLSLSEKIIKIGQVETFLRVF